MPSLLGVFLSKTEGIASFSYFQFGIIPVSFLLCVNQEERIALMIGWVLCPFSIPAALRIGPAQRVSFHEEFL
jgi:hypothetical protein